ncbi:MAG TPA: class I adenylate-forming enzyme family protein [Acidimicrobiales bacterium]|nr:class I adenylate-forming enzyme family protein [Acidimicrobiales bacterium]
MSSTWGCLVRSFNEAIAEVAAAGQPFEVIEVERHGVTNRVFKNAPTTLRQFFDSARGVEETFLVYEDEEWTFAHVMREVDALGDALVRHYGIQPGDRVGIAMRNYPEWVIAFGAIVSVGAISVSLNAWWTEDELDFAINDAGLSLFIGDSERILRASRTCARRGARLLGVRLQEGTAYAPDVERWSDVVVTGAPMPHVDLDADSDATILYTSGTTGFPKGAVSTHGAICQTIMAFSSGAAVQAARRDDDELGSGQSPCFILIVPLFHVTGCVPVMLSCFTWHFKLVMMYKWDPERALALIERHHVTNFVGVPTQAWDLIESPSFSRYDTSSLTAVGGGGAPAPPTLVARVEQSFTKGRPNLGYGMTETNAYGPGNYGEDYLTHPTSTGRVPTIVMDADIRDESLRSLRAGERGEIWLKSPTLIRGYWRNPDATREMIQRGWLRTGDLGHVSDEGFLYVEDRAKDMIIRAGENVYSAQVESAIYEHPAVYEAAVFGLYNERLGEEVAAAVMVRQGSTLTTDDLRAFLSSRLAAYMIPTRVAFTRETLPRNPAGKLIKREMPELYFPNAV